MIMGVSGSGKTTIGQLLADRLAGSFLDADDFHPVANIDKLSRGDALNDADRWPWLDAVAGAVRAHAGPEPLILACSALKESYRNRLPLRQSPIIFLSGSREIIKHRLSSRRGHFMPSVLLDDQLDILEEPNEAITVSIAGTPRDIVDRILLALR